MKAVNLHILITSFLLCIGFTAIAQRTDTLPAVKLLAQKPINEAKTVVPVQQLNKESLNALNSLSVADAVKYFSGVLVKDYGGIGGLKTISVRSLGANHTGVMYDGILLSEVQGGQIDLGKLSLDNIESITLYNGQPTEILLPARSFASASILSLKSTVGKFDATKKADVAIRLKAGSFGLIDPSLFFQYHFNDHFYNSLSAEYQGANGVYPFKAYEAGGGTAKRINSDIKAYRAEYDAGYKINDSNVIKLKAYYYNSDRGLPNAVIFYNNHSDQRLKDENYFIQSSWNKKFSKRSRLLFNAKYTYGYSFYLDPSYPNQQGKLENKFHQKELYFSGAYAYSFSKIFSLAYASDFFVSKLTRSDVYAQGFAMPVRNTWLNNITAKASFAKVELETNLLYTHLEDRVQTGPNGKNINIFSPAASLNAKPFINVPIRLRAFYKNIFRAPTFNDLYYTNVGNTALRPEYAKQYDVGITYEQKSKGFLQTTSITTDIYYNRVKDKIIALPRENNAQWTMINVPLVEIKGLDAGMQFSFKQIHDLNISARLTYSYQNALDKSDKNSVLYNTQLPYVPKHSGSISLDASYKKITAAYNVLLSSYRYRLGEPIPDNLVKEWATQDVSLSYLIITKKNTRYKLLAELNNIFNKQYEIIKYFPMPRFNYRLGISIEF